MTTETNSPIVLNENNWSEILSEINSFPFRISEIRKINKELELKRVSFKYNMQGRETYVCDGQEVILNPNEYLISTNHSRCEVMIDEHVSDDKGLCVDMNMEWLQEGLNVMLNPISYFDNENKHNYFLDVTFFNKFQSNVYFDTFLQALFLKIKNSETLSNEELGMQFIRTFLFHHSEYITFFKRIPVLKKSSQRQLYDKMLEARNMLHDSRYADISITDVSRSVFLSPFRFFHLFKETFGISPYKYLLQLKLNEAMKLFKSGKYTWTEIASLLYFSDIQSFSKSFKKFYRMSPNEYAKFMQTNVSQTSL